MGQSGLSWTTLATSKTSSGTQCSRSLGSVQKRLLQGVETGLSQVAAQEMGQTIHQPSGNVSAPTPATKMRLTLQAPRRRRTQRAALGTHATSSTNYSAE